MKKLPITELPLAAVLDAAAIHENSWALSTPAQEQTVGLLRYIREQQEKSRPASERAMKG